MRGFRILKMAGGTLMSAMLATIPVRAELLVGFDVAGRTGDQLVETGMVFQADMNTNAPFNRITRGSGIRAAASTNGFVSVQWTVPAGSTVSDAIASNDYVSFSVAPLSNKLVTVTNISIQTVRAGSGPAFMTLRSSANGYSTDLGSFSVPTPSIGGTSMALSVVSDAAGVEFRLYGYGATAASTGTARTPSHGGNFGQTGIDLAIFGTISDAVPVDPDLALIEALGNLTNAPVIRADDTTMAVTEVNAGETKAIFFDALDYEGSPTRVYAYLGIPAGASPENPVPAVVLVHGGGGTAFLEWVAKWTNRGYAAISIAVEGQTDGTNAPTINTGWHKHDMAGPVRVGIYGDTALPLTNQWMYHAVADTILANSLMRSLPMVITNKVGVMGISWGGVIVSTAMGIDERFAFAIPVYGCGHKYDIPNQYGTALENNTFYRTKWDPILRISNAAMPALWFSWPQENNFSLDAQAATYYRAPGPRMVSLIPNLGHGHPPAWNPGDSYAFADSIVSNGTPWCVQDSLSLAGGTATVVFTSNKNIDQAYLISTTGSGYTGNLTWTTNAASVVSNGGGGWTVTAVLPPDTKGWFVNALNGSLVASSDYRENIALQTTPATELVIDHAFSASQSTTTVLAAYFAPSYVEISSLIVTGQTHPGSLTVLNTLPLVMKNPAPATEALRVRFDNTVAGLTAGQSATGLLVIAWDELDGSTGRTQVAVRATVRTPSNVIFDVTANWSSKPVSGVDHVFIRSNAVVTLDQTANAGSLTVNDEASPRTATLVITQHVDLTVNGAMRIGAGTGAGMVTQSAGNVYAVSMDVNSDGAGNPSSYTLAGGTVSVGNSLAIKAGGAFSVLGGTFSPNVDAVTNNGELVVDGGIFSRSIAGVDPDFNGTGAIRVKSGTFSLSGGGAGDLTSFNVPLFEVSGGSVAISGQQLLKSGAEFKVSGSGAMIWMDRLNLNSTGGFRFQLGPAGVSPVNFTFWVYLSNLTLVVDGAAYTGGPTNITLIDSTDLASSFMAANITLTNFSDMGLTASVAQDTDNGKDWVQLVLSNSLYGAWARGYGITGSNLLFQADPDGDGLVNGMEYALGGDPSQDTEDGIMPVGFASPAGADYVYRRRVDAAARGLAYAVRRATNLADGVWTSDGCVETGAGPLDAEFESVTNRITVDNDAGVKLRVEFTE